MVTVRSQRTGCSNGGQAAERGYYAGVGKIDLPLIDGEVQGNG